MDKLQTHFFLLHICWSPESKQCIRVKKNTQENYSYVYTYRTYTSCKKKHGKGDREREMKSKKKGNGKKHHHSVFSIKYTK